MSAPLAAAIPLILATVLVTSAVGKLTAPGGLAGWAALDVPRILRRVWLIRAHP